MLRDTHSTELEETDEDAESAELIPSKSPAELRQRRRRNRRLQLTCAFNILNGTLGPGMLVLPLAFSRTGLSLGLALLVLDWSMSYIALRMLLETSAHVGANSLVELARAHGPRMSLLVDWSVVLYFYGTCISYLILIGGTFDHLLHYHYSGSAAAAAASSAAAAAAALAIGVPPHGRGLAELVQASSPPSAASQAALAAASCLMCEGNETMTPGRTIVTVFREEAWKHAPDRGDALLSVFTLGLMLPLSCSTSLDALGSFSAIVSALYAYLCGTVWSVRERATKAAATRAARAVGWWPVMQAIPTMVYCFSTQAVYLPALEALHEHAVGGAQPHGGRHAAKQARQMARGVTDATFLLTLLAYASCGVGGFLHAPGVPAPNVLDSFHPTGPLLLAYVCLVFALSLSFPVMFVVARTHVASLLRVPPEAAVWRVTGVLILLSLAIAIGVPSIDAALGLLGATCSVTLCFIIPAVLYLRLVCGHRDVAGGPPPSPFKAHLLIAFGLLVACLSIPVQLWELFHEHLTPERSYVPRPAGIAVEHKMRMEEATTN